MASGSRKHHTKTRNSCSQCKKRRVKCDCTGPRCSNCRRRGEACEFGLLPSHHQYGPSAEGDQQRAMGVVSFEPLPQLSFPDLETLELLHHYQHSTALTCLLAKDSEMLQVWREHLPLAAQSHEFLMHGILALSALHKAQLCPSAHLRYNSLALKHHTQGSQKFRSTIEQVSSSNSTAVFGFSIIVAIFQFKYCISTEYPYLKQGIDMVLDTVSTLRRTFALVINHDTLFKQTCFRILPARARKMQAVPLDKNIEHALEALDALNLSSALPFEEKRIYTSTIEYLRRWYSIVSAFPRSWDIIMRWPMTLSFEYVALLERSHPMALVILAYWCVPVHHVNPRWYIDGWAESAVRNIALVLPEDWRHALDWPVNEMKLQDVF